MAGGEIDFGRPATLPPALARLRERHQLVPAHRPDAPAVVGAQRDGDGWKVQLLARGEVLATLNAEAARKLAAEILDMADVIEGKRW